MPSEEFYDNSRSGINSGASNVIQLDDYRHGNNPRSARVPRAPIRGENPPQYRPAERPSEAVTRGENPPEYRTPNKPAGSVARGEDSTENSPFKNKPGSVSKKASSPTIRLWDNNKTALNKIRAGGKYPASKSGQKGLQNKLNQLQKNAPEMIKKATGGPMGALSLAKDFMKQVDPTKDWLFIPLLVSFAALKDLFDIMFAALGTIPIAGVPLAAAGIVVSFIMAVLLFILTITVLILTGSDLKNRGVAKYILTLGVGFIIEAVPGLDWLPMAIIEVLLTYGLTLFDRMMAAMEQKKSGSGSEETSEPQMQPQPQLQYADKYVQREAA